MSVLSFRNELSIQTTPETKYPVQSMEERRMRAELELRGSCSARL
jgi:hypothetical protein